MPSISSFPLISQGAISELDVIPLVDVDDTTAAPSGTTKKITIRSLFTNIIVRGALRLADAVTKIIPGATSFSVRDNNDTVDNLLVTNAGAVTVRGAISVGGGATVGGDITLNKAATVIRSGATSIQLQNNSDVNKGMTYTSGSDTTAFTGDVTIGATGLGNNRALSVPGGTVTCGSVNTSFLTSANAQVTQLQVTASSEAPPLTAPDGLIYIRNGGSNPGLYFRTNGTWFRAQV